jgi:uncharacterized membrane protein
MRTLFASLLGVSLVALLGCETKSPPGGPGAKAPTTGTSRAAAPATTERSATAEKPIVDNRSATFKLETPLTATTLKQGEKKEVKVSISRGSNFKEDVALKFMPPADAGLKVDNPPQQLTGGQDSVSVWIEADKNAKLGKHEITVEGTPQTGLKTSVPITIDVKKAE